MNILVERFPKKVQDLLTLAADILWLALGSAFVYYTLFIMRVAKNQTSPGLGIRMDYMYLSLVIGGGYLAIVALRKIAADLATVKSAHKGGAV